MTTRAKSTTATALPSSSPTAAETGVKDQILRQPPIPWRRILGRNWATVLAVVFLVALAIVAIVPWLFGVANPLATAPQNAFAGPSIHHLFGTDEFGRDLFSRVIYGARVSLGTAAAVVICSMAIGVPMGLVAGYLEGITDVVIMRLVDVVLAFPAILLAMGLIAVLGQGMLNGAIAVAVVAIPGFARLTRASVLSQKQRDYVLAARSMGASQGRLMFRTVLPNCLGPLLVQAAFIATWAILLEASLSFLGLGVKPPTPSWGQMLNNGKNFLYQSPWYGLFPGLALTLVVLAFNTIGDTAQRLIDRGWRGL